MRGRPRAKTGIGNEPFLVALVTYDHRLADAARGAGIPVSMPGLE